MSPRRAGAVLAALALAACAPTAPAGVSKDALDTAVNDAVGDPNTCVLIGKMGTGAVVYQFGTHVICAKAWPSCTGVNRAPAELLTATSHSGAEVKSSCPSNADGSRGVGWAAGPVPGHADLAYVAVMEGPSTPPGMVIADKVAEAFKAGGL